MSRSKQRDPSRPLVPRMETNRRLQLRRVVKNDARCESLAGLKPADAVSHVDAVNAACAGHRPVMNGKDHSLSLHEGNDLCSGLHARSLLGQHEFTACEIFGRVRKEDGDLKWKHMFAVEVLMQTVEVSWAIFEEERRGSRLSGIVTLLQELLVASREGPVDSQRTIPVIRNLR